MKKLATAFVLLMSVSVFASDACDNVPECVELNTKLTGVKYLYPKDLLSKKFELNNKLEMTKENADAALSEVLMQFNFMKVPSQIEGTWKILSASDVRYTELPRFNASKTQTPDLPKNVDFISLVYQGVKGGTIATMARNLRPFLSRYGRVIDTREQQLIVNDRAGIIRSILPLIQQQDSVLTKEELAKHRMMELEHAKDANRPPIFQKVDERKTKEKPI